MVTCLLFQVRFVCCAGQYCECYQHNLSDQGNRGRHSCIIINNSGIDCPLKDWSEDFLKTSKNIFYGESAITFKQDFKRGFLFFSEIIA